MRRRRSADDPMLDLREPATAGSWAERYPTLWEFLWDTAFEDGATRVPGTLLLFRDGMKLKACLSDRDEGEVAFVTGDSPDGILSALEAGLREFDLDWRASQRKKK